MISKLWQVPSIISSTGKDLRIQEILSTIFTSRGFNSKEQIDSFLQPPSPFTIDPADIGIDVAQLNKSVAKIHSAVAAKQPIIIFGDYDADGITATAILWEAIHSLGARAVPFIPSREEHGYGLSIQGIKDAISTLTLSDSDQNPLIITVDNGIVAHEAADYCAENNIELIITDHHQPGSTTPNCYSLVHTDVIAGSGVAWMLVKAIDPEIAETSLDLVTIGTVADMMPLSGPNRSIVKAGLKALKSTKRVGLYALFEETGIEEQADFSTYHINFVIAPRLNAMGRLKHAIDSVRLLCTTNYDRGHKLAQLLSDTNTTRQEITFEYLQLASDLVPDVDQNLIIIDADDFHEGVIGLVAGKLAETHYRPAIVISRGPDTSKASARSVKGVNIIDLIRTHDDLLINAGGHPMAAGFSIHTHQIEPFKTAILNTAQKSIQPDQLVPRQKIDAQIELDDISDQLFEKLEQLKPFGIGNPQPIFSILQARITDARALGKDQRHLKLKLQSKSGQFIQAIGFGLAKSPAGREIIDLNLVEADLAFAIDENIWKGRRNLQLKLKDVRV